MKKKHKKVNLTAPSRVGPTVRHFRDLRLDHQRRILEAFARPEDALHGVVTKPMFRWRAKTGINLDDQGLALASFLTVALVLL